MSAPEPLGSAHDVAAFDCGENILNDWLKHRATRNEGRFSRTYVVAAAGRVVGYYCISSGAVERATVRGNIRRNAPDVIPVAVLGRLAVDRQFAGKGLGADLLADALKRIAAAADAIGMAAVLVHAKDDRAKAFYRACAEFNEFPADSRTLFLAIDTIRKALD
ncbi:GNAT family N-acetyltransferase [Ciceribacter sp. L1K23]|nr:GNAT family N-acetyltransferase [Ciceribacter sp. L1K23]